MRLFDRKKKEDDDAPAIVGNNTEQPEQTEQVVEKEQEQQKEQFDNEGQEQQGYRQAPGNQETGYPINSDDTENKKPQEEKKDNSNILFKITTVQSDKIKLAVPVSEADVVYKELKAAKQLRSNFEYPGFFLDGSNISFFTYELEQ